MTSIKLLVGIATLMGFLLLFGGCISSGSKTEPDLVGWIDNAFQPQSETPGQLLINSPDNKTSDKFMVSVTDKTVIFDETGEEQKRVDFGSIITGQKVVVWFSGPVMESYPAQASADKIVITEEPLFAIMPAPDSGRSTIGIEVFIDEFNTQKFITKGIVITHPGELVVTLPSNLSTGFDWSYETIGKIVLEEVSHEYIGPEETGSVGAPGKSIWLFKSIDRGKTELRMEYSQPWEGGIKTEWSLILTITVE